MHRDPDDKRQSLCLQTFRRCSESLSSHWYRGKTIKQSLWSLKQHRLAAVYWADSDKLMTSYEKNYPLTSSSLLFHYDKVQTMSKKMSTKDNIESCGDLTTEAWSWTYEFAIRPLHVQQHSPLYHTAPFLQWMLQNFFNGCFRITRKYWRNFSTLIQPWWCIILVSNL